MKPVDPLKRAIRDRWSLPSCVETWVGGGLHSEFHDPACRRAWRTALRRAVKGSGDALDLGTGPGTIAQLWAELGFCTTGVDFSPGMVTKAREWAAKPGLPITFLEGDVEDPPFSRRRFDVISSRFVLYTLPHPGYAMRRWVDLLRPGGAMVLIGHHRENTAIRTVPPQPQRQLTDPVIIRHQAAIRRLPFMNHTVGDLQVLLEAVGLRNIRQITMKRVIAAKASAAQRSPATRHNMSPPFIIVGYK